MQISLRACLLIALNLTTINLGLMGCRPSPQSSSKEAGGGSYPLCKSNNGTGYGAIFTCGNTYCAKDNPDYTAQCVVDGDHSCALTTITADPNGHPLDTSKDVIDVGTGIYYNTCGGSAYGDSWSCGDPSVGAKCAKGQPLSSSSNYVCVVSGGTKVTDLSKLKSASKDPAQDAKCAGGAGSRTGSSVSNDDVAEITFWDAANEQGTSFVVKVKAGDVGVNQLIGLTNLPASSAVTLLKSGYTVTVVFADGSTTATPGSTLGTVDDYSQSYPGKTVGAVRVDSK